MTGVLFKCDTTSDKHIGLLHTVTASTQVVCTHLLQQRRSPLTAGCSVVLTCISVAWFAWCGKGLAPFSCLPRFCCYKKTRPDSCRRPLHCPVTSLEKVRKHFSLALFVIVFSHCCGQDCCSAMDSAWRDLCSFYQHKNIKLSFLSAATLWLLRLVLCLYTKLNQNNLIPIFHHIWRQQIILTVSCQDKYVSFNNLSSSFRIYV